MYNNIDKNRPETDDQIYYIGNRTQLLLNKTYHGPTPELYNSKHETEIQQIIRFKDQINLDTMKVKEIETIIYPLTNNKEYKEIWQTKFNKHLEINYMTAYKILPIFRGQRCPLCRREEETLEHIFITCTAIEPLKK